VLLQDLSQIRHEKSFFGVRLAGRGKLTGLEDSIVDMQDGLATVERRQAREQGRLEEVGVLDLGVVGQGMVVVFFGEKTRLGITVKGRVKGRPGETGGEADNHHP